MSSNSSDNGSSQERSSPRNTPSLPRQVQAQFNLKQGEPQMVSRTPMGDKIITIDTQDGLDVLLGHCRDAIRATEFDRRRDEIKWGQSLNDVLLLKPANNTTQANYVILNHNNYHSSLKLAWRNFKSWSNNRTNEMFVVQLFAYSSKPIAERSQHRASEARIQAELEIIQSFASETGTSVGAATAAVLAQQRARNPNSGPLQALPTSTLFSQLNHIDNETSAIENEQSELDNEFAFIPVEISGVWVNLKFNLAALRRAVGLPRHNVLNEGIFSQLQPPAVPLHSANIIDIDHELENDLAES